jgi:hypothetical protein
MATINNTPKDATISGNFNSKLSSLRVNGERLMKYIHEGCEYGQAHRYGRYVSHSKDPSGPDALSVAPRTLAWLDWLSMMLIERFGIGSYNKLSLSDAKHTLTRWATCLPFDLGNMHQLPQ